FAPVTTPPMLSSSMATAVWALNRAGAAASKEAMPIAAAVKYSLALSLMGALLVRVVFVSRATATCARPMPARSAQDSAQSMSSPNKSGPGRVAGGRGLPHMTLPPPGVSIAQPPDRPHPPPPRPRRGGAPHQIRPHRRAHELFRAA